MISITGHRGRQIQSVITCHHTCPRTATGVGEMEQLEFCSGDGDAKWYDSACPGLCVYPREIKANVYTQTCAPVFSVKISKAGGNNPIVHQQMNG